MSNEQLKPCPFCGHDHCGQSPLFVADQGDKWGRAVCAECGASGPEVRTGYDTSKDAAWHADALYDWNRRASPTVTALVAALEASRLSELTWKNDKELEAAIDAVKEEFGL
jgi:transcription elongation factor Elf1